MMKMMSIKIDITTHPNGYSLGIGKEEFMYYTPQSLLEGFAIRLGLNRLNTMNQREINKLMDAAKEGSLPKRLQQEVEMLTAQVRDQKKLIAQLRREVRELKQELGDENYLITQ